MHNKLGNFAPPTLLSRLEIGFDWHFLLTAEPAENAEETESVIS